MKRRQRQAARRRAVQAWRKPVADARWPLNPATVAPDAQMRQPVDLEAVALASLKEVCQVLATVLTVSAVVREAREQTKH